MRRVSPPPILLDRRGAIPRTAASNHFRSQADDFQITPVAQLTGDGAKDTRAARILVFFVDEDESVAVEFHVTAVIAAGRLLDADDHALDHFAGLDVAAGDGLLHA